MKTKKNREIAYASFKDGWYDIHGHWEGSRYYDVTEGEFEQARQLKIAYLKELDAMLAHRMKP